MENSKSYEAYRASKYSSTKHSTYFEVYDRLFGQYRGKEITFVEVGIFKGGSLFMWRDFFGPQARIIGLDLNPEAKKWEEHGFEIHIGSQSDPAFWEDFKKQVGPIDVLLDDGGHTFEQQIVTTEMMLDAIKDGGMLVVEDTHTSYIKGFGEFPQSFMQYVKRLTDRVNMRFSKFPDDRAERRFWSIEIFESIVAFHVNRAASRRVSTPTNNGGIRDEAKDFRYDDARSDETKADAKAIIDRVFAR